MIELKKKLLVFTTLVIFFMMTSAIIVKIPSSNNLSLPSQGYMDFDGQYDWEVEPTTFTSTSDYITYTNLRDNFIIPIKNQTETITNLLSYVTNKLIRIDSAEELYNFSKDVSFIEQFTTYNNQEGLYELHETIDETLVETLLSLDYVLGQDIDYSVMESRSLDPIGYDFYFQEETYSNHFTGTFNGQGFEIENLYISGYDRMILTDTTGEYIDIPIADYYAFFTYNDGEIRNLGLVNQNMELLQVNEDLLYLANLVGDNQGVVDSVYVIDTRSDVTEAGMRYRVGNTPKIFSAAGIVHTNNAYLSNAYFVSKVVINGNYINKFYLEPIVYTNNAPSTTAHIAYDSDVYLLNVVVGSSTFNINQPSQGVGESTSIMKSGQSLLASGAWYFYPNDGYPILQGMTYDNGYYLIEDAIDLAFFPELLEFDSIANGKSYLQSNFRLTTDIDMGVLAEGIYETPASTFYGQFIGTNPQALNQSNHYYIHHLNQTKYLAVNSKIYAGLFSVLGQGALVKDINFTDSSIILGDTSSYYSYDVYVGSIAGEMIQATIENIYIDVDIDMGESAIGSIRVGGVVGQASGLINRVSQNGDLRLNNHQYTSITQPVDGRHYIGGIIGKTFEHQLVLTEVANRGNIYSYTTSSSISLISGSELKVYTGGIIGYLENEIDAEHQLSELSNSGDITLYPITASTTGETIQYMGGVIGLATGKAPVLEIDNEVVFGQLYNEGNVIYTYESDSHVVYASGIINAKFDEQFELALLKNYGSFNYDISNASFTDFNYTALVYDLGEVDFTLSRVYNYGEQVYAHATYQSTFGIVDSLNHNHIYLRYSANYGDISYLSNLGNTQISLLSDTSIYTITGEENISYTNVHNYGDVDVVNINTNNYSLYIAGFSKLLSDQNKIENSLNAGNIVFADISGSGNIYVAGFVNQNEAGDLESFSLDANQPIATEGVINSLNYGDISTTYSSTKYGVDGTNNTFVGGLVTLNKKSIQDSANLGNIAIVNTSTQSTFTYETASYYAGLTTSFSGGIVAGGIAAMVIDGDSRIYDTANSGNVIAKAYQFVRTGGILGVSLYQESEAGGVSSSLGLVDSIEDSVLSNGLNFGNISAITSNIASYSTGPYSTSFTLYIGTNPSTSGSFSYSGTTTDGTQERPAVYASSGGVIGYGLSVMRNMLNHGIISSTDVAGGVVGATYALGSSSGSYTTVVNITTAVNYGEIKAIASSDYSLISNVDLTSENIDDYYMNDLNSFIFPSGYTRELPRGKRGFGGIFGRLQRGLNGVMTSEGGAFDFIVNANENIDLVGRLDQVQNFSSSLRFFRFNNSIYYSAKPNDTTQTVFTGFQYLSGTVTDIEYTGYYTTGWWRVTYVHEYEITITNNAVIHQEGNTNSFDYYIDNATTSTFVDEVSTSNSTEPGSNYDIGDNAGAIGYYQSKDIKWITENPNDPLLTDSDSQYMYDDNFEMRTNPDLTEFIYYAEADLLADRFKTGGSNPRENGMYVLSTSAGQTFGAVLPRNINRDEIELIDESENVSLYDNYTQLLETQYLPIDIAIIDAYNGLRQTTYSDQANLIDDMSQRFMLQESSAGENILIAQEVTNYLNSGIDLGIDYENRIITLAISMESFGETQTTASFDIINAFTSSNALIGIRSSESSLSITDLQDALYIERYTDITNAANTKADLTINLPDYSITNPTLLTLGWFSVYSEAFYMDPLSGGYEFSNNIYYNDYRIDIYFLPNLSQSTQETGIDSVSFNQNTPVNVTTNHSVDLRSLGSVNYDGSLTLNYIDENDILVQGYDFSQYFELYFEDDSLIPQTYYDISSTGVDALGNASITIDFSSEISSGDYYFMYRYFPNSAPYRVDFTKGQSSENELIDFTYYTEYGSLPSTFTDNFDSYIDLGETLDIDEVNNHIVVINPTESYLSETYHIAYMTPGSLEISPFARVISATLNQVTYISGYKVYELIYIIQSESGINHTYTHEIYERQVEIEEVQKNNNTVDMDGLFVEREDDLTVFRVDLGLSNPIIENNEGVITYFYGDPTTVFDIDIVDSQGNPISYSGITWYFDQYLMIQVSNQTLPGDYYISIQYLRTETDIVDIRKPTGDYLMFTKEEGQNAYLSDIRFSEFANETNYPDIFVLDSLGNVLTAYNPQAYFNGFDYDGADIAGELYFRVDGQVSNVPLDDYEPIFDNFLPDGATIERRSWDDVNQVWVWTNDLSANFTIDPVTGIEPAPNEDKVTIRYRVISEDGLNMVYYDISVTDVVYNVTFIFDIYYCQNGIGGTCVLAQDSLDFNQELVIINIQNLLTNGEKLAVGENPAEYPGFSEVLGLENKMTQFFYTDSPDYHYRFSRNKSYFYNFSVELPLDEYLNDIYAYDIEFVSGTQSYMLNDASDYVEGLQGKYFYIEDSINLRTRRFNIYIYPTVESSEKPYGLFDFFRTWS